MGFMVETGLRRDLEQRDFWNKCGSDKNSSFRQLLGEIVKFEKRMINLTTERDEAG